VKLDYNNAMQPFINTARNILIQCVDTVLPPRCVVSGDMVDKQGMIAGSAWAKLNFLAPPLCVQCGIPFDFEVESGVKCSACLDRPPPFETARAALKYDEHSRDMILGFKHADKTFAVRAFIPWLMRAGEGMLEEADLLVPVPLHYRRMIARRYNQSAIIAQSLSKASRIPADVDAIKRIRATKVQGFMKAAERHKNVKAAFSLNPKADVKGKTIILIDDVFTTGATAKECTKTLLKGGAAKVHILTLARVVREEFF
jgi:ComF family protein